MDNRPVSLDTPIKAFRLSDCDFKFTYTNLNPMPEQISAQLRVGELLIEEFQAEISGQVASFSIPADSVRLFPPQCRVFFLHDGEFKFGAVFVVDMGLAPSPSIQELTVTLSGDQEFLVNIVGMDSILQVAEQVAQSLARKMDNWQVDTKADADAFVLSLAGSAFIEVVEDETNDGARTLYWWNMVELQEPLLL